MIQRMDPFSELRQMQDTMDRMWRRFGNQPAATANGDAANGDIEAWAVPLDVAAQGENIVIRASLPGVDPSAIHLSIEDNVLTIRGETASQFQDPDASYLMRERRSGSFHRALRLPDSVDQDRVEPHYEHGVLTITVPKAEAKRARQLQVRVGGGTAESG